MKKELERIPNIPEVQKEILNFWKENKTFEKSNPFHPMYHRHKLYKP